MENFRIESLEINKIGAFEHIKMDFPKKTDPDKAEIHILTGENGTGKSTILEALAEVCKPLSKNPENYSIRHKYQGELSFINVSTYPQNYSTLIKASDFFSHKNSERLIDKKLNESDVFEFAMFAYSGYRLLMESPIVSAEKVEIIYPDALLNALHFDNSIDTNKLAQWVGNAKIQEALSFQKNQEDRAKHFSNSIETIERIIEEITNEKIKFDLNSETMQVNILMGDKRLALMSLPDGLKSMISWIGDFVMRMNQLHWMNKRNIFDRNFILFLDEIEVHLHPAWQRKILPVVQKLFKNAQIFISTHSPFVVGSVDGAWIHKLKKDGAYVVLDGEPVLTEDAESYETILEEIFGIKERFGDEIEKQLNLFAEITREILKGDEHRFDEWNNIISFFKNQERPDEIMGLIIPQIRQINRIRNQVVA